MDDKKNQHKPVKLVDSFKNLIGLENDVFWEKGDFKCAESSDSDPLIDSSSSSDDSDIVESEWFANDGPIDAKPKYDFEVKLITQPKFDFEVKPTTSVGPNDLEAKPIELVGPKYDFEAKPIKSLEPKCDFTRQNEENKPVWTSNIMLKTYKGAGLLNLGNTCFLNAVLQCFMHTVPLFDILLHTHVVPCDRFCLICVFKELISFSLAYEAYEGRSISPWRFVENLSCMLAHFVVLNVVKISYFSSGFHKYQQEDAHEFLQYFLNRLESRCSDVVQQVFGGRLVSKLRCCNCGHFSNTYEPLINVSLEIKNANRLYSALESFTRVEKLDDPEI
ncbi:ubiquitin carboxyl-terminal hydrolase 21-like, partial [Capsicum annuum]|uniref:ubiquitin carboxyl-terminal hydrolase 21-like n=1 Tax=Capsicum annuum TaxID=4072 RepID=UPI001FB07AA5